MTPEEQAEFLAMKKRAELAESDRDNYRKTAENLKDENAKLLKVNQEYFNRLISSAPDPEPSKKKKRDEDEDEKTPTAFSIVEDMISKKTKK